MKKNAKKRKKFMVIKVIFLALAFFILVLYINRAFTHTEIDDVTPGIECIDEMIDKSDILWVIPIFENKSIAENNTWCAHILSLNKTLGLHGVYHTYNEFGTNRSEEYIELGANEFEKCFGFYPEIFKAPQLELNSDNKKMLQEMGFDVKEEINQLLHKVYHCSDTGEFSNKFIDYF